MQQVRGILSTSCSFNEVDNINTVHYVMDGVFVCIKIVAVNLLTNLRKWCKINC